jgi:hypothetical protein
MNRSENHIESNTVSGNYYNKIAVSGEMNATDHNAVTNNEDGGIDTHRRNNR